MLDLIAFALLILACSYWKFSGQLLNEENTERDLENVVSGEKQGDFANKESIKVYKEKILVIMAGDDPNVYTLHHQPQPLLRLWWPRIHHVAGLLHRQQPRQLPQPPKGCTFVSYLNVRPKDLILKMDLDVGMYVKDFMNVGFFGSTQRSTEVHSVEWCIAKEVTRSTTVMWWVP